MEEKRVTGGGGTKSRILILCSVVALALLLAACPNDSHGSVDLDHIKVTSLPHVTTYTYSSSEKFNSVGLGVTAFYTDGSREPVADYSLSWDDTDHTPFGDGTFPQAFAGSVETVVVTWNGKSDHFSITVHNADHPSSVATPGVDKPTGFYAFPLDVILSTATAGATIYYTIDGTDPSKTHGIPIATPGTIHLVGPATLKAVALKDGANPSSQLVAQYLIGTVKLPGMLPSVVEDQFFPLQVTFISNTPDSVIYYTTDGSPPTESSTLYNNTPFTLSEPKTLKFRAFKDGMDPSGIAEVVFTAFTATESDLAGLSTRLFAAEAGGEASSPVTLPVNMELSIENWMHLLEAIDGGGKFVELDLSACTASSTGSGGGLSSDGTFDGLNTATAGKDKIVSLILPDAATSIAGVASGLSALKSASGANIITINTDAFYNCTSLASISFPKAESTGYWVFANSVLTTVELPSLVYLGEGTFHGCSSLTSVNIPNVTSISNIVFGNTGTGSLTITLGAKAPTLGNEMFRTIASSKTITVKVPSDATGYGSSPSDADTVSWGNGFRGGGWTGSAMRSAASVNGNISLFITSD